MSRCGCALQPGVRHGFLVCPLQGDAGGQELSGWLRAAREAPLRVYGDKGCLGACGSCARAGHTQGKGQEVGLLTVPKGQRTHGKDRSGSSSLGRGMKRRSPPMGSPKDHRALHLPGPDCRTLFTSPGTEGSPQLLRCPHHPPPLHLQGQHREGGK